jgi:small-conductance mechanosensitive channel
MVSILDLFKYKKPVEIKDEKGEVVATVWVRVLGDWDLDQAYRAGRIKSSKVRKELRDTSSDEYFAEIAIIEEGSTEDLTALVKQSKQTDFYAMAQSAIDREDIPKIEDFAVDPDAPTLEEQERKDIDELDRELKYQQKIKDFVDTKNLELDEQLKQLGREELVEAAKKALTDLRALSAFIDEVLDQKVFRGTYTDKECKNRAFKEYEDYLNEHGLVKNQLRTAYQSLELNPEDIKN